MSVGTANGTVWADCGTDKAGLGDAAPATSGRFNFRVTEEDDGTTEIKVTAHWGMSAGYYTCISRGNFEESLERAIRLRAEREARADEAVNQ